MSFGHVGINALFLEPRMGGLDTYARELIPNLLRARPGLRLSVYLNERGERTSSASPGPGTCGWCRIRCWACAERERCSS